jgi:hypothetical protein
VKASQGMSLEIECVSISNMTDLRHQRVVFEAVVPFAPFFRLEMVVASDEEYRVGQNLWLVASPFKE